MSPATVTILTHVLSAAVVPAVGVLANYLIGRYTREGSKLRKGAVAYMSALPSQVQAAVAVEAPGISQDERIKRLVNLLDAAIASGKVAVDAAYAPDEPVTRPDIPSVRPPAPAVGEPGEFR